MKKTIALLIVFALVLAGCSPAALPVLSTPTMPVVNTYYVSTSGNDANPGSESQPFKTAEKALSMARAGSVILFKRSGVWHESLVLPRSGVEGNVITIDAYGEGANPLFSGSDVMTGWSLHSGSIYKKSGVTINAGREWCHQDGVRMTRATSVSGMTAGSCYLDNPADVLYVWTTDSANPNTHTIEYNARLYGVDANGQSHWRINNIDVTRAVLSGYAFRSTASSEQDIIVTNANSSWNGLRGFDTGNGSGKDDIVCVNCNFYENLFEGAWIGFGSRSGIEGGSSHDNGKNLSGIAGSNYTVSDNCIGCFIRNTISYNGYGGTSTFDCEEEEWFAGVPRPQNSIFENNIIGTSATGTDTARDACLNSVWKNNVIWSSKSAVVFRIWNGSSGAQVINNTFHRNGSGNWLLWVDLDTSRPPEIVSRNIFYAQVGQVANISQSGNYVGNPQFVDARSYRLRAGSPACGFGAYPCDVATATKQPPTNTVMPPTATRTPTATPTRTPTYTPTADVKCDPDYLPDVCIYKVQ